MEGRFSALGFVNFYSSIVRVSDFEGKYYHARLKDAALKNQQFVLLTERVVVLNKLPSSGISRAAVLCPPLCGLSS